MRHWHEDDDGLLAPAAVDLLGGGDVELPQLGLQVRVDLEVQQGLADPLLDLVRLLIVRLDNLTAGYSGHSDTSETGECHHRTPIAAPLLQDKCGNGQVLGSLHGGGHGILAVLALVLAQGLEQGGQEVKEVVMATEAFGWDCCVKVDGRDEVLKTPNLEIQRRILALWFER